MGTRTRKSIALIVSICLLGNLFAPSNGRAQLVWPFAPPTTPQAQRNALNVLHSRVNWFRNATRNAPNFATGNYAMVWQEFQQLRDAYSAFKATLTPDKLAAGANELAELDAGLDILQQAFDEYQQDVAAGRATHAAFESMCQALNEGAALWLQELDRVAKQLRI